MRTTLREKFVLWMNGIALAVGLELMLRSHIDPVSLRSLAVIATIAGALAIVTTLLLRP